MTDDVVRRMTPLVRERGDDLRQEFIEEWERQFKLLSAVAESPIELLLAGHLLMANDGYGEIRFRIPWNSGGWPSFGTVAGCQVPIGQYRADFLFRCCHRDEYRMLVVECDGHDFHERTKAQARRDKSRDRWFLSQGIAVMRFAGSEIWADPAACIEPISARLTDMIEEMFAVTGLGGHRKRDPLA